MVSWWHEFYGLPPFTNFIWESHALHMQGQWKLISGHDGRGVYSIHILVVHCLLFLIRLMFRWHFDPSHCLHWSTAQKVIVFHFVQWVTVLFVWSWIITWAVLLCWMNQTLIKNRVLLTQLSLTLILLGLCYQML